MLLTFIIYSVVQTTPSPPPLNNTGTTSPYVQYHSSPSPPSEWMTIGQATPSLPLEWMIGQATPSPPLEWMMDQTTPSPPSEWMMDQTTPSPPLEWMMDQTTPSPPSEWMDQSTLHQSKHVSHLS